MIYVVTTNKNTFLPLWHYEDMKPKDLLNEKVISGLMYDGEYTKNNLLYINTSNIERIGFIRDLPCETRIYMERVKEIYKGVK